MRRLCSPVRLTVLLALALPTALLPSPGRAQPPGLNEGPALPEGPPQVLAGQLTDKDPLDRVRKASRCQVHELRLERGKPYIIELRSGEFDAFLRLEDAGGNQLATDNNSGGGTDARLLFEPKESGTDRLIATSYQAGQFGGYELWVACFGGRQAAGRRDALERQVAALNAEGVMRYLRGEYGAAGKPLRDALAMRQKLSPPGRYPDGHPDLATSLSNLGCLLQAQGQHAEGVRWLADGLTMQQRLLAAFADHGKRTSKPTQLRSCGDAIGRCQGRKERFFRSLDAWNPRNRLGKNGKLLGWLEERFPRVLALTRIAHCALERRASRTI